MTLIVSPTRKAAPPMKLYVIPASPCVVKGGSLHFTAEVTNSDDDSVIWAIRSGGGEIDTDGNFTAPASAGSVVLRCVSELDPLVYRDVTITVADNSSGCCSPKVDITPKHVILGQGASCTFGLYIDGEPTESLSDVTWSVVSGDGAFASPGVYTAPTGFASGSVTVRASAGTCYSESNILVSSSKIALTIAPKVRNVYLGSSGSFTATVYESDNDTVQWDIVDYNESDTNPVSMTPSGWVSSSLDLVLTSPSALPANPYIKVRATSIVDQNVYDEAYAKIYELRLPISVAYKTKWDIRGYEPATVSNYNTTMNGNTFPKRDILGFSGAETAVLTRRYAILPSDPYKGVAAFPVSTSKIDINNVQKDSTKIVTAAKPTGIYNDDPIWITSYDTVTPPSEGYSSSDTDLIPNAIWKIPIWEKVFITIDTSVGSVTSPSAAFDQHDFSSLGSTVTIVTGNPDEYTFLSSDGITFVYSCAKGFFSGDYGESFDPAASARDVVTLSAMIDGVFFSRTLYFRPEPDLPEIFPELIGPEINYPKSSYLPGQSFRNFCVEYGNPFYLKASSDEVTKTLYEYCWDTTKPNPTFERCDAVLVSGNIQTRRYNITELARVYLPFTATTLQTLETRSAELAKTFSIVTNSSYSGTSTPPQPACFMNYYPGMWSVILPLVYIPEGYSILTSDTGSYFGQTSSANSAAAVSAQTVDVSSRYRSSTTKRSTSYWITEEAPSEPLVEHNSSSQGATGTSLNLPRYVVSLTANYNRHISTHLPDLGSRKRFPKSMKFELLSPEVPVHVDNVPDFSRYSNMLPSEFNISSETGVTTSISSNINSIAGPSKVAFVKATPIIFGGSYTKSVIVPVFFIGDAVSRYRQVDSEKQVIYGFGMIDSGSTMETLMEYVLAINDNLSSFGIGYYSKDKALLGHSGSETTTNVVYRGSVPVYTSEVDNYRVTNSNFTDLLGLFVFQNRWVGNGSVPYDKLFKLGDSWSYLSDSISASNLGAAAGTFFACGASAQQLVSEIGGPEVNPTPPSGCANIWV